MPPSETLLAKGLQNGRNTSIRDGQDTGVSETVGYANGTSV